MSSQQSIPPKSEPSPGASKTPSLLSAALATQTGTPATPVPIQPPDIITKPIKTINTKHSGQQGLLFRSDGRLFATAGWDTRVRVYSEKTMREVAVLAWHRAGCYTVAFSDITEETQNPSSTETSVSQNGKGTTRTEGSDKLDSTEAKTVAVIPKLVSMTLREQRIRKIQTTHWLAAGSKDGKISLWDVF
jgi:WD40 repeat protein